MKKIVIEIYKYTNNEKIFSTIIEEIKFQKVMSEFFSSYPFSPTTLTVSVFRYNEQG